MDWATVVTSDSFQGSPRVVSLVSPPLLPRPETETVANLLDEIALEFEANKGVSEKFLVAFGKLLSDATTSAGQDQIAYVINKSCNLSRSASRRGQRTNNFKSCVKSLTFATG